MEIKHSPSNTKWHFEIDLDSKIYTHKRFFEVNGSYVGMYILEVKEFYEGRVTGFIKYRTKDSEEIINTINALFLDSTMTLGKMMDLLLTKHKKILQEKKEGSTFETK